MAHSANARSCIGISLCAAVVCVGIWVQALQAQSQVSQSKRPVTIADAIRMTRLANPDYIGGAWAKPKVAEFSPNGKQFIVVVRKGNLENNTNEYSLLLFRTAEAFRVPTAEVLLTLASSSNRPAIQRAIWLDDNQTIAFLGEQPGEEQQLYTFNCATKKLNRVTNHPTSVIAYSMTKRGNAFAFVAERPANRVLSDRTMREGFRVTTQWLHDLIAGIERSGPWETDLFLQRRRSKRVVRMEVQDPLVSYGAGLSLSSDGRYLVLMTHVRSVPEQWKDYKDEYLQILLRQGSSASGVSRVVQYTLIDTQAGRSVALIDAPLGGLGTELAWAPDNRSVVVTNVHLPLDIGDVAESEARRAGPFVVQVRLPSREIVKFPSSDLKLVRWDAKTNRVLFESGRFDAIMGKEVPRIAYEIKDEAWREADAALEAPDDQKTPDVVLEEDLNTPPKIYALDSKSKERSLLLNLNPQFNNLEFANVEHVKWKARDGHDVDGGLYIPPGYVEGQKYPLILQTHGFNPRRFWIDGPWTTAFAAQAFASKAFVVLQVNDWPDPEEYPKISSSPKEALQQMSSFEGAIDYLDGRGLIDRNRVGIIGFSRTCFHVKYALTHSRYPFAAASVSDGLDAGYFQYIAFSNTGGIASELEGMNGGSPFAESLASWLGLSPGYNLHKVRTPMRIEALGPASLLGEWEWFAGLVRLGKPVELTFQPDADHMVEKPWERLVSQQGNVDWFCFWLKGEEDTDPGKAEKYARWRELRKLRKENSQTPN